MTLGGREERKGEMRKKDGLEEEEEEEEEERGRERETEVRQEWLATSEGCRDW